MMKTRTWRVIFSGSDTPAMNMALDGQMIQSFQTSRIPTLRFYTWNPEGLSLGRFQALEEGLNIPEISRLGIPAVRRMTGGGAIFHHRELTYSLVCTEEDLDTRGVKASFEALCGVLIRAYQTLGIQAQFARQAFPDLATLGEKTAACFAGKELYDLVVQGRKLGGNAQRRLGRTLFQHGSIPLDLDWDRLQRIFLPGHRPLPQEVTTFKDLGVEISPEALGLRVFEEFQRTFPGTWSREAFSPDEIQGAQNLAEAARVPGF